MHQVRPRQFGKDLIRVPFRIFLIPSRIQVEENDWSIRSAKERLRAQVNVNPVILLCPLVERVHKRPIFFEHKRLILRQELPRVWRKRHSRLRQPITTASLLVLAFS